MIRTLYQDQVATVRTEYGETDPFRVAKAVRQGCILSRLLENIYEEKVMRNALKESNAGIRIGGSKLSNLRYADDTTLLPERQRKN